VVTFLVIFMLRFLVPADGAECSIKHNTPYTIGYKLAFISK